MVYQAIAQLRNRRYITMNRFRFSSVTLFLIIGFVFTFNTTNQAQSDYFPVREWRTSKPEVQGLDKVRIKKLIKRINNNRIQGIDSLLIVRNGYLVTEKYFNGWSRDRLHTLQSNTKSITSLLVGIAIDQGSITSVDDKVVSFFPEYQRIRNLDDRKAAMSVRDLLTMRTGFDWSEDRYEGSPLQRLNTCECDWLKLVLDWPMREQPGTRFEYNSGGVILLAGIIRNATGMNTDAFAQQFLFDPLGIRQVGWYRGQPDALPHTGGGLLMRPRDMAKIGYLLLKKGRWGDRQIVSESWFNESMQHWIRRPRTFRFHPTDYGYLWWLMPIDGASGDGEPDADILTASGAQGQWIFAIPRYDMVVVVTGSANDFAVPVDFLYSDILQSVTQ
jgi:CubicO group peptidase (beta-lactamase class C family)